MFTIRVETLSREGSPYRPAQYSVHQAKAYYVVHEQYDPVNGHYIEGPASSTKLTETHPAQESWPWRTRIEVHPPQQSKEHDMEDVFFVYLEKGYIDRVFVMNDAGKTVDTIT